MNHHVLEISTFSQVFKLELFSSHTAIVDNWVVQKLEIPYNFQKYYPTPYYEKINFVFEYLKVCYVFKFFFLA